jgi:hypothetical protein
MGGDTIQFSIAGTIQPTTQMLDFFDGRTRVDGWSAPGAGPGLPPTVILDGAPFQVQLGFALTGNKNVMRGLGIVNFSAGIHINGNANWVHGNTIGTNAAGNAPLPNGTGIVILGNKNLIGTNGDGTRDREEMNLISGNSANGILIQNGNSTRVAGNHIGTNLAGTIALPNLFGIWIQNFFGNPTSLHIIGTNSDNQFDNVEGNLISGNGSSGIVVSDGATDIIIAGNIIGLNRNGNAAIPNMGNGIEVFGSVTGVQIGTDGDGVSDGFERNVISGNAYHGVDINGTNTIAVSGNYIGLNRLGTVDRPNGLSGISAAPGPGGVGPIQIGGTGARFRNIVSGNTVDGVNVTADNVTVQCNFIGTDVGGTVDHGNGSNGVFISGSNTIVQDNRIYFNDVGLYVLNSTAFVDNNNIDNVQAGLLYDSSTDMDATDNWWGDPSGPTHVNNPLGVGDAVVEFGTGLAIYFPPRAFVAPDCP